MVVPETPSATLAEYIPAGALPEEMSDSAIKAIATIERGVGACQNLDEAMDLVWEATCGVLPHDRIGLTFVERDRERIAARYYRAAYDTIKLDDQFTCWLSQSSLKHIFDTGDARIINNLEAYLNEKPDSESTRIIVEEGIRSNLALPLLVENRQVGFIFFSSRKKNAFDASHAHILLAVLERLSQTIEKAWLIKQLSDSNESYLHMLGFVAHEIKAPLVSLISRGEVYLGGYFGETDELAAESIGKMVKMGYYLSSMVSNYLDFSKTENGEMHFSPTTGINLGEEIISFAADTVTPRAETRGSSLRITGSPEDIAIDGDLDLLRIVVINLLDNAVKYGNDGIEVSITTQLTGDHCRLVVRNEGIGFTEEEQEKLFKRFSRLRQKGTEDIRGSGLGLYLTWWIVQRHGGKIAATAEPGKWAEFTIVLPNARHIQ